MKQKRFLKTALLFAFTALMAVHGSSEGDYYDYYAVYMDRENLERSVFYVDTGKEITNPGKIYYARQYIYVNEKYKGVHVIDNSSPEKPVKQGFIMAPGCIDMAVKGDIMYLDNAVDLVSFDLIGRKETSRIKKVFPELEHPRGYIRYYEDRPENLILVEWVKR
ncbi:MAG: hypothetical protein LBK97_04445 [Prevotellaceae bacterium]|jgi:hypothetical protein|nr:hypothetical protein [Prevotellaceae bacterium]